MTHNRLEKKSESMRYLPEATNARGHLFALCDESGSQGLDGLDMGCGGRIYLGTSKAGIRLAKAIAETRSH